MAGNGSAGAQLGLYLLEDYINEGPNSAICVYLELADEAPLGGNPFAGFMRRRFCDPPPPPTPPSTDFFNAGGVACRLYRVTFATGNPGGPDNISVTDKRGPIGLIREVTVNPDGSINKRFVLTSGTGSGCPREADVVAGTSDARFVDVFCRIVSIVPLEGDPGTEVPIYRPDVEFPEVNLPPITINIPFNGDGFEVEVPINFGPIIETPFGPVIDFTFSPTANFNPQIDIDLGLNPRFGLDINLEFVIPLTGNPEQPVPVPGAEPIPLPPTAPPGGADCPPVDYERIEKKIEDESCCKPVEDTQLIGVFLFETTADVYQAPIPDSAQFVTIDVVPDNNSRRYKLAGDDSEIALGNASITSSGKALGYEKIFTRRHVLEVPPNLPDGGIRVSLKQGCQITVRALIHAV